MTRRIAVREDCRLDDDAQLLIRLNDDRDVTNALKLALAEAPAYQLIPGYAFGAVTVSCFLVRGDLEAQIVVRGTRWSVYGLARVGDLRALGCAVVATDVYEGEEPLPLSDRHVDVIVCPYPPAAAPYADLNKVERGRLRARLADQFTTVLRAFDPRRTAADEPGSIP